MPRSKEIEGQLNIFDFLKSEDPEEEELADPGAESAHSEKVYPVEIKGLCDDAYCPGCNACLDELKYLDSKNCPHCGLRIDWGPWHYFNDEGEDLEGAE